MLYGRDSERARIGELLDAGRASTSGALVIVGEPGIGKSALLEDTRDRAGDMQVLAARGVESESELPFAALHQLLRPALEHIDELPQPQAAALRGALGLEVEEGSAQERFLIFAACLSLLSELAERRPVLCLVDDAHWLDAGSADALRFVVRRLDAEGIVMLFGAREGEGFDATDIPQLHLQGLEAEAAHKLLAQGAGVEAAADVRDRLLEQTRGNALALLELPSVLTRAQLAGSEPLPEALPLTQQVENVFLNRVHRLEPEAQRLMLIAAADNSENATIVARATAPGDLGEAALAQAERAGLLSVSGTTLKFRHPLVRSAVYGAATSKEQRAAHQALAEVLVGDPEQLDRRAWHLAAATLEPDESIVSALDEAAGRAQGRGAFAVAVRALERAAELTTDDSARAARFVEAARCASLAAADDKAVALGRQAEALGVDDPLQRATLVRAFGRAEIRRGTPGDAPRPLMKAALDVAPQDPRLAFELLLDAAWAAQEGGDPEATAAISQIAYDLDDSATDKPTRFIADLLTGMGAIAANDHDAAQLRLNRAVDAGLDLEEPQFVVWSGSAAMYLGDVPLGGRRFARGVELARARGQFGILAPALSLLGVQNFIAQRYDQALLAAAESLQFAREVGAENLTVAPQFVLAGVAAIRGQDDDAVRYAEASIELSQAHGLPVGAARSIWALALLDMGRGRWADALARYESLADTRLGLATTIRMRTTPERIEAAVRAGRLDDARAALPAFEEWAQHARLGWVQLQVATARALVSEGEEASEHFEEALRRRADAQPFDLARTQLLYGEHLRRERRRTDSRVQLRAALEAFERLGAEPWAERARTELRASGETARRRDPSTTAQLTPQELQIARFVARGLSNKEVAAQLFLSPRTIDSHLRSVFAKLSITSRTQLARLPLGDEMESAAA